MNDPVQAWKDYAAGHGALDVGDALCAEVERLQGDLGTVRADAEYQSARADIAERKLAGAWAALFLPITNGTSNVVGGTVDWERPSHPERE